MENKEVRVQSPTFGLGWLSPFPLVFESDEFRASGGLRGLRFDMGGQAYEGAPERLGELRLWEARFEGMRAYARFLVCREMGLGDREVLGEEAEAQVRGRARERLLQFPGYDRVELAREPPGQRWCQVVSSTREVFSFRLLGLEEAERGG